MKELKVCPKCGRDFFNDDPIEIYCSDCLRSTIDSAMTLVICLAIGIVIITAIFIHHILITK